MYPQAEITFVCVCSQLRRCLGFLSGGKFFHGGNGRNKAKTHEETERFKEPWVSC